MSLVLTTQIALPAHFRPHDVLSLHARDTQQRAEKVEDFRITKGLTWLGRPALLQLHIEPGEAWAKLAGEPETRVHLYGKRDARPGRKMGHVTRVSDERA